MGFYWYSNLLCDEFADRLAAPTTFLEAVRVDVKPGTPEPGSICGVILMKARINISVAARVKSVLEEVTDERDSHLGSANG